MSFHCLLVCCCYVAGVGQATASDSLYVDLGWQDSAGVGAALNAAADITARDEHARIEFLVHGKDIKMFADGYQQKRLSMIKLGEALAHDGRITFNVCAHALAFKNITIDQLPPYFKVVDYVPDQIRRLRARGYESLEFQ